MLNLFSRFLLVCLKNFEKIKKYLLIFYFFLEYLAVALKENPKRFLCSSFVCWELSRVNSFSRFCFPFYLLIQEKPKTPKIFQCVSLNFFSFYLSHTEEKTTMKMLSSSLLHNCWSNKEPILPCLLLLNKMFADSSLVHGTLALLLFSYRSVLQVKGNNDNIL